MEIVIVVTLLVAFAALAPRAAPDSRDGPRVKDQEFASYGVTWADLGDGPASPAPARSARPRRSIPGVAKQVAGGLTRRGVAAHSTR